MWQAILWAAAIAIAFCLWDSISRANANSSRLNESW